jgi:metallo-beta-lactamase family protein
MESTYGDREHRPLDETMAELAEILHDAAWAKEKVLIPTFSVGRAQLLLYAINELMDSGRVPRFEVYLDSPMASEATRAYRDYVHELDEETRAKIGRKDDPFGCDFVRVLATGQQSRELNDRRGAMVVLAGSGMCNGGRIVHHLRHNLYKRDVRVIIAGYQARGTLGRRLVEGEQMVRIFGEEVPVRARVHTLGGFSAHAGQNDLVRWAGTYFGAGRGASGHGAAGAELVAAPILALTHGEDGPRRALASRLGVEFGLQALLPVYQSVVRLEGPATGDPMR